YFTVSVYTLVLLHAAVATGVYRLSLHDALPIYRDELILCLRQEGVAAGEPVLVLGALLLQRHNARVDLLLQLLELFGLEGIAAIDRKSTRLNSSHVKISYAVFCLKKKT